MKLLIINGPNLNLLGKRQPEIYGDMDFDKYLEDLRQEHLKVQIDYFQSNIEGEIIDRIQQADRHYDGIILNAASYTHTSVGIADAIQAIGVPVVEVHISNIFSRESFRRHSLTAPYTKGIITGFGLQGYKLAVKSFLVG